MPRPPATFSPLTTTKSGACSARRRGRSPSSVRRPSPGSVSVGPEQVGWVPQQAAVYGKLSVRENLRLFARLERVADRDATVDRMLDLTGLRDRSGDELGKLSGGNQQRVNIAIGL